MKRHSGFTLADVIITAIIIGILIVTIAPNFFHVHGNRRIARAKCDMKSLSMVLESFYIDNNSYPPMDTDKIRMRRQYKGCEDTPCGCAVIDISHIMIGTAGDKRIYLTTPVAYISSLPSDPFRTNCGYGYGSNGQSYYILTCWGPDRRDSSGKELDEREYTGAQFHDIDRAAFRTAPFTLSQLTYEPSNGMNSAGDIIRLSPKTPLPAGSN